MKTDTIFYRLFKTFPSIFFELIGEESIECDRYRSTSVEVKQTAFRIDGVLLPDPAEPNAPIYFSEFQFQPDANLFARFFAEIFIYLAKTDFDNDWRGVIVWASRSLEPDLPIRYWELLESQRVQRIYLDELSTMPQPSIGISLVSLIVEPQPNAAIAAKRLVARTRQELDDDSIKREILELIETIIIYKFPKLGRTEIEQMLELGELKQTKVYQEAKLEGKLEGKLEAVSRLLELGLTAEQIAIALSLDLNLVQQTIQSSK